MSQKAPNFEESLHELIHGKRQRNMRTDWLVKEKTRLEQKLQSGGLDEDVRQLYEDDLLTAQQAIGERGFVGDQEDHCRELEPDFPEKYR